MIACLLLVFAVTVAVNPLWECRDHLDGLRHLGPNGILAIMLVVACAGLTFLKSLSWLSLSMLCLILRSSRALALVPPVSHEPFCVPTCGSPLPLRI